MVVSGPQPSTALAARGLPATVKHTLQAHVGAVLAVRFNRTARPPIAPLGLQGVSCRDDACAFVKLPIDDGEYCLTAGNDKLVKLWNPHRGRQIKTYAGHGREVAAVAVYGNGHNIEHLR